MKYKYRFLLLSAIITYFAVNINPFSINAQMSDGGNPESWLLRNTGSRPMAMAGVYAAIVNEPSGIFYNPAGTSFMQNAPTINSSVSVIGLGRTQASLSWAQEILPSLGIGAGINNLYSGSFTGRNVQGLPTRELNSNQISAILTGSYRFEFISMGAGIKYINNSLNGANISASGVSFDLGVKLNVMDLFSFGMAMNNIGGNMKWNTASGVSENIPFTFRTGVAAEFGLNDETIQTRASITGEEETISIPPTRYLLVGFDAVMHQYDSSPSFILGAELVLHELIAVRAGLSLYGDSEGQPQLFPMNYWGTGISLRPQINMGFNMQFDYSISNEYMSDSRISHNISLIFEL